MKFFWWVLLVMMSSRGMAKEPEKLAILEPIPLRSYLLQTHPDLSFAEAFSETGGKVFILYKGATPADRKIALKDVVILKTSNAILTFDKYPVGFISRSPTAERTLDSLCSLEFKEACKLEIAKGGKITLSLNKPAFTETMPPMNYSEKRIGKLPPRKSIPQCNPPHCCGEPDGCDFVRDTWGGVSFRETCNSHDRCYYTIGTSAASCNETFKNDLLDDCKEGTKICSLGVCIRDPIREAACVSWATAEVLAVILAQGEVYADAQIKQKKYEEANSCSSVPKEIPDIACPSAVFKSETCPEGIKGASCKITSCPGGLEVNYYYICNGTAWEAAPGGGSTGRPCQ